MQDPYYVLFQIQGKLEHLKSLLGMLLHSAYNQRSLLYEVQKQFDPLYNHPMEPFPKHQSGKLVHIVYNQYKYRKF